MKNIMMEKNIEITNNYSIDKIGLPIRISNLLLRNGIRNISQLLSSDLREISKIKGLGSNSIQEISNTLRRLRISEYHNQSELFVKKNAEKYFSVIQRFLPDEILFPEIAYAIVGLPIDQLCFPKHIIRRLSKAKITFIDELLQMTEEDILRIGGIGKESIKIISSTIVDLLVNLYTTKQLESEISSKPKIEGVHLSTRFWETMHDESSIEQLGFSIRVINSLRRARISTIEQLVLMTDDEILKIRNIGENALIEIQEKISKYKLEHSNDIASLIENSKKEGKSENEYLDYLFKLLLQDPSFCERDYVNFEPSEGFKTIALLVYLTETSNKTIIYGFQPNKLSDFILEYSYSPIKKHLLPHEIKKLEEFRYFDQYKELLKSIRKKIDQKRINISWKYHDISLSQRVTKKLWDQSLIEIFENHKLFSILKNTSIYTEIEYLTASLDRRDKEILVYRNIENKLTLEEIASVFFVTRERIRQIEKRIKGNIQKQISTYPYNFVYFENAFLSAQLMGDHFRLVEWLKNIFGSDESYNNSYLLTKNIKRGINFVDLLLTLATVSDIICINDNVKKMISLAATYPNSEISAIRFNQKISQLDSRLIISVIRNSGAIRSRHTIFKDIDEKVAKEILSMREYIEIETGWFSRRAFKFDKNKFPKNESLLNNALRILKACPSAYVNEVQIGVNQAVNRLGYKVVPLEVFSKVLEENEFVIDGNIVHWPYENHIDLGNRDIYFIELIGEKGPIVTFDELCEKFKQKNLSRASAVAATQWSPIVFRISQGLYKLCGASIELSDYNHAEARRERISRDFDFYYSILGEIILETNIGSWGQGGTISINSLPDIEGSWYYLPGTTESVEVKASEDFLYGFLPIFEKEDVSKGDRLKFILNTWTREIKVEKINE